VGDDVGENCGGRWFLYCGRKLWEIVLYCGGGFEEVGVGRRGWG